ncbi:MAG: type II secretion protein F [Clostridiales bacterium]|jgi:tight adherence protein B|nr:type II secretion protein F [Clostridiales bacterium]
MEQILLAISSAVLVYSLVLLYYENSSKIQIRKRLSALSAHTSVDSIYEDVIKEKRKKNTPGKFRFISHKFEETLAMSGMKLNAQEFLIFWFCTTMLPVLLLWLIMRNGLSAAGAGIVGFLIPPQLVQRSKKKRQQLFDKQLSECLIVMSNCIKSGYSFQQAMESVAADMQPPISTEFSKTLREIRYGVKQDDALHHMVDRVQNKDLGLLVSAVVISSQVGANLTDILDNISETIKDRIKIRDDVKILSAQGRISGLIIGLLPVVLALFLMIVNPDYILSFFDTTTGKIMIGVGVILEIIGFTIVNRIVDIQY